MDQRLEAGPYVLDGAGEDLHRLLEIAQVTAGLTRSSLQRADVRPGWRVLDCGCGPIGALPILAELVGSDGQVIGVDLNDDALDRARHVLHELDIVGTELIAADVHDLDVRALGGPVDLIYTRCFLMHQPDSGKTLAHLANLLRPGGHLIAHEPLATPPPSAHPRLEALEAGWSLLHDVIGAAGVPRGTVERLPQRALDLGFVVDHATATWILMPAPLGFELHATTLEAARDRATRLQVATDEEIDALVAELRAAGSGDHQWVSTPLYLDLGLHR